MKLTEPQCFSVYVCAHAFKCRNASVKVGISMHDFFSLYASFLLLRQPLFICVCVQDPGCSAQ